jgi:hypothetical protein
MKSPKHPRLIPLINEFFGQETGKVKLKEIVEYVEERFDQEGLGKISDTGNIIRDKRNTNDMFRRALNKISTVKSTKGKTSKKKYYYSEEILLNDMIRVFFLSNELHGGYTEMNHGWIRQYLRVLAEKHSLPIPQTDREYSKVADLFPVGSVRSILPTNIPDITDTLLENDDYLYLLITLINLRRHFSERDDNIDELPFDLTNLGLKNRPDKWFTINPEWMGTQYFGFQGPGGINFLVDNIKKNMIEADFSKTTQNISEEINWLVGNKKDNLNNQNIFTLALLHLNRSLQSTTTS